MLMICAAAFTWHCSERKFDHPEWTSKNLHIYWVVTKFWLRFWWSPKIYIWKYTHTTNTFDTKIIMHNYIGSADLQWAIPVYLGMSLIFTGISSRLLKHQQKQTFCHNYLILNERLMTFHRHFSNVYWSRVTEVLLKYKITVKKHLQIWRDQSYILIRVCNISWCSGHPFYQY